LEDLCEDILGKAQRGLGLSDEALAAKAGIPAEALRAAKSGRADEAALARLAPTLGLHGPSLIDSARKAWHPRVPALEGFAQVNTRWGGDITVNAYLAWDAASRRAVVFDTGTDAAPLVALVRSRELRVELILLTHTHPDHVAALEELRATFGRPRVLVSAREPLAGAETFAPGAAWSVGTLRLEARDTSGHSPGGTTYVVHGLARPVAVVGDALFAGSMGGAPAHWAEALRHNREQIFTLPDDTVLGPGHGPLTTVAEEKARNPFFPEFK
jgi:glyoxylase-like metal-dependent hydrolase (beta-lactamase superfamily II)